MNEEHPIFEYQKTDPQPKDSEPQTPASVMIAFFICLLVAFLGVLAAFVYLKVH